MDFIGNCLLKMVFRRVLVSSNPCICRRSVSRELSASLISLHQQPQNKTSLAHHACPSVFSPSLLFNSWRSYSTTPTTYNDNKVSSKGIATHSGILNSREIDNRTLYGLLKLTKFTKSEIDWRFDRIIQAGERYHVNNDNFVSPPIVEHVDDNDIQSRDTISKHDLEAYLIERYQHLEDERQKSSTQKQSSKDEQDDQCRLMKQCAKEDAAKIFQLILDNVSSSSETQSNQITKEQFHNSLNNMASSIHYPTILPLSASSLLMGLSVGVTAPIMPFVAEKLHLSSTFYGIVISSFGFSKMVGNVPFAILVDYHGRKPYLVHSLWLVGLGVAGMGLSTDWIELSMCRMTVGLGVAALTTASTLTVADVSTPLSRARTFSPLMSSFSAGMALGPAIGGILHDAWGIQDTFFAVGLSYCVASIWNQVSVSETKRTKEWYEKDILPWHCTSSVGVGCQHDKDSMTNLNGDEKTAVHSGLTSTIATAVKDTTQQWTALLKDQRVQPVVIMNGFYMLALSGTQFTLLPLLLTGGGVTASTGTAAGLALSASTVGQLYMWMSACQVLGNPVAGSFADRVGKNAGIVAGGALTSFGMAVVPVICAYSMSDATMASSDVNWPLLIGSLGVWSLGGTLLATSHVAAISDITTDSSRSQAIALLRTAGDVGYLCGAIGAGLTADFAGDVGTAMQVGSVVLGGSTAWFGLRSLALQRLDQKK